MAVRILLLISGLLALNGSAGAQSQDIRPQIRTTGESNGTAQDQSAAPLLSVPERITQFEAQVQSNPEDAQARAMLISLYRQTQQSDKAMEQLLWIIGHHPEWSMASMTTMVKPEGGGGFTVADYQQLKAAWEGSLADHPADAEVLYHSGLFLQGSDGERALQLLRQARQLQPSNPSYLRAIAGIYEAAVLHGTQRVMPVSLPTDLAMRLRDELQALNDPALLSQVGSYLARVGPYSPDNPDRQLGLRLLERATTLEPDNPQWAAALTAAKAPPGPQMATPPGAVRIGSAVAEANLIRKVEPVYPALAKAARVSGTIEFTAVISKEGNITNLQLVRGHPLLVNAAKEAVLQYLYKPTLLNGNPVPVVTNIVVSFELPPQ